MGGGSENYIILIASYLYAALRLLPSISLIARMSSMLNNGTTFTETIFNDLIKEEQSEIISKDNDLTKNWDFKKLEFKNVSFAYNEKNSVLNDLNFKINLSESVLITGPSGCGKSTTVDLILGFLNPQKEKF